MRCREARRNVSLTSWSIMVASFGTRRRSWSATLPLGAGGLGVVLGKAVPMKAATTRQRGDTLRMRWTR